MFILEKEIVSKIWPHKKKNNFLNSEYIEEINKEAEQIIEIESSKTIKKISETKNQFF